MNLESFNLIGHSLGAYIAGNYTLRYSQYVKKLILLSPIGIRVAPESENGQEGNDYALYGKIGGPSWIKPAIAYLWTKRASPWNLARVVGEKKSKEILDMYVSKNYTNLDIFDQKLVANYMYHILFKTNPPETSIQIMFNPSIQAHLPLGGTDKLGSESFSVPISFMYGD